MGTIQGYMGVEDFFGAQCFGVSSFRLRSHKTLSHHILEFSV